MARPASGPFYDDPTNTRSFIQVVLALCLLVLSWISVFCRFVSRHQIKSTGLDDYFILPSLVFFSVYVAGCFKFHELVPGVSADSHDVAAQSMTWLIITEVTYSQSMIFLKLALGFFFLRLVISPVQRKLIYLVMIVSTFTNLFLSFWNIGLCGNPASYLTDVETGKCITDKAQFGVAYTQAIVNSITDVSLSCIPFMLLKGSRMPVSMRAYVTFILVLATAGCVASIARLPYIHTLWDRDNFYEVIPTMAIISTIELASGIISGSLATLRPLLASLRTDSVSPNGAGRTMGSGSFLRQSQNHGLRILNSQKHDALILKMGRRDSDEGLMRLHGLGFTFGDENCEDLDLEMNQMPKEPRRVILR